MLSVIAAGGIGKERQKAMGCPVGLDVRIGSKATVSRNPCQVRIVNHVTAIWAKVETPEQITVVFRLGGMTECTPSTESRLRQVY